MAFDASAPLSKVPAKGWDNVSSMLNGRKFTLDTEETRIRLLAQEDTDGDGQITIDDTGPKHFRLRTVDQTETEIIGTYRLSNLLQELTLASNAGQVTAVIDESRITENPVDRLQRLISGTFWDTLTRRLDGSQIHKVVLDRKADAAGHPRRIYTPHGLKEQYDYYTKISQQNPDLHLDVVELPKDLNKDDEVRKLLANPGLLALDLRSNRGLEYVVPGGRFNEFYYWDSYFSALGLLESGKIDLVCDMVDNMIFQINHYGCVLNANRSYYLWRSQPPFLTNLVIQTYHRLSSLGRPNADEFLRKGILSAIKEYHSVWMNKDRLDPTTGLSRYRPPGQGIPPEVEKGHFDWFLAGVAKKEGLSLEQLYDDYSSGRLKSKELDDFFRHDRAMRESGHDTSARLDGQAADVATIDLNALLHKYETDIAWAIKTKFNDTLHVSSDLIPGSTEDTTFQSSYWNDKAASRRLAATRYLWDEEAGIFRDYNTAARKQTPYQSATAFSSLWSGLASESQAKRMVKDALPRFEKTGGIVSTVLEPDSSDSSNPRARQWDYPNGWAPHQVMTWDGLRNYGFVNESKRVAYRWLYLLTRIAVDYNGRITEKYDVTQTKRSSDTDQVEYGNQGCEFQGVNLEGFGWTNASYQYGLTIIGDELLASLRQGIPWADLDCHDSPRQVRDKSLM